MIIKGLIISNPRTRNDEGILVLENFEETIKRGKAVSLEQIMTESKKIVNQGF